MKKDVVEVEAQEEESTDCERKWDNSNIYFSYFFLERNCSKETWKRNEMER